jgi:hypothetical protein
LIQTSQWVGWLPGALLHARVHGSTAVRAGRWSRAAGGHLERVGRQPGHRFAGVPLATGERVRAVRRIRGYSVDVLPFVWCFCKFQDCLGDGRLGERVSPPPRRHLSLVKSAFVWFVGGVPAAAVRSTACAAAEARIRAPTRSRRHRHRSTPSSPRRPPPRPSSTVCRTAQCRLQHDTLKQPRHRTSTVGAVIFGSGTFVEVKPFG